MNKTELNRTKKKDSKIIEILLIVFLMTLDCKGI